MSKLHFNTTHGHRRGDKKSSQYTAWINMKDRCCNPKYKTFSSYGGRGIKVCQRWLDSFEDFLSDMGPKPSAGHSLDRFPDKNGNYEPGNCRWATVKMQNRNKRNNRTITLNGITKSTSEWAEEHGLANSTVKARLNRGWSAERSLGVPVPSSNPSTLRLPIAAGLH